MVLRLGSVVAGLLAISAAATGPTRYETCFARTLRFVVGEPPTEASGSPRLVVSESEAAAPSRVEPAQAVHLAREWLGVPEFHNPLVYRAALDKLGRGPLGIFKKNAKVKPRDLERVYARFEGMNPVEQDVLLKQIHNELISAVNESNPARLPGRAKALGMSVKEYGAWLQVLREPLQDEKASLVALREVVSGGRVRDAVEDFVHLEDELRNPIVYRALVQELKGARPKYQPFRVQKELEDAIESYATLSPQNQSQFVQRLRYRLLSMYLTGEDLEESRRSAELMGLKLQIYREYVRRFNEALKHRENAVLDEALHALLTESPSELSHALKRHAKDRRTRDEVKKRMMGLAALGLITLSGNHLASMENQGWGSGRFADRPTTHAQLVEQSDSLEAPEYESWWEKYAKNLTLDDGKQVVFYSGTALAFAHSEMRESARQKRVYKPITFQNEATFHFLKGKNASEAVKPIERWEDRAIGGSTVSSLILEEEYLSLRQGEEFMNREGKVGKLLGLDAKVPYRVYIQLPEESSAEAMKADRNIYEWRPLRLGGWAPTDDL